MTSIEQDKELRDKVANIVEYWDFSPLQDEDSRIERLKNEIMQLITADRKRVALEARVEALSGVQLCHRNTRTEIVSIVDGVILPIDERIAKLKAQQEEK